MASRALLLLLAITASAGRLDVRPEYPVSAPTTIYPAWLGPPRARDERQSLEAQRKAQPRSQQSHRPHQQLQQVQRPRLRQHEQPREPGLQSEYSMPICSDVVIGAVKSLYQDRLQPTGRILLKRLRERWHEASGAEAPLIDPRKLKRFCTTCPQLYLDDMIDGTKEFAVYLVGYNVNWVDMSGTDNYPAELWAQAAVYFESLTGEDIDLPGGRYECARELQRRRLPFLADRTLGELCHIVQLAISHWRLLGYSRSRGRLVPFKHSDVHVQQMRAALHFSSTVNSDQLAMPVATWPQLRTCLWNLLSSKQGKLALSNVKRLSVAQCGLVISETALGYVRLQDLMEDPRVADMCWMQRDVAGAVFLYRHIRFPWEDSYPFSHEFTEGSEWQPSYTDGTSLMDASREEWSFDDGSAFVPEQLLTEAPPGLEGFRPPPGLELAVPPER